MDRQVDLVIIGAGPAGMTAALYASRGGLETVMIDGTAPGGKLLKTYMVDNYPGTPSIPGPDLAVTMYEQSVSFGASYEFGEVESVSANREVTLKNGDIIQAKAVIAATGAKEKLLNIPGEQEALGHGESFCAICDGAFFRGKEVVVIGGGNSAVEEAQFLTRFASKVIIVIRRDVFRASAQAQLDMEKNDKIQIIRKHIPKEILLTDGKVSGIVLENVEDGDTITVPCEGIFPYIGHIPETAYVNGLGITNANGFIETDDKMRTTVPGIFAAGDCVAKDLRQIVTACSDGAIAATECFEFVKSLGE